MLIKKAKITKTQKLQKRKQTKKRTPNKLTGGTSKCDMAYVTEPGFSIPDKGTIKGFTLPEKRALIRGSSTCK